MSAAVEVAGLAKSFPPGPGVLPWRRRGQPVAALRGVDLRIRLAESVALLGPNGAGKTTLLKILCSVLLPDAGQVSLFGTPLVDRDGLVRRLVGYVNSDERSLYWRLSARENLAFFSALSGGGRARALREADRVLELVELAAHAERRVMNLSTGMRQRLCLARGLLGSPRLLLLDEPTRSLDPTATRSLERELRRMTETLDLTLLFVTHSLEQARRLATRAVVLRQGRVAGEVSLDDERHTWRLGRDPAAAPFPVADHLTVAADGQSAVFSGTPAEVAGLLAELHAAGVTTTDLAELPHPALDALLRSPA